MKKLTLVISLAFWLIPNIGFTFDKVLSDSLIKDATAKGKQCAILSSNQDSDESMEKASKLRAPYVKEFSMTPGQDIEGKVMFCTPWFQLFLRAETMEWYKEYLSRIPRKDAEDTIVFLDKSIFVLKTRFFDKGYSKPVRWVVKHDVDSTEEIVKPCSTECDWYPEEIRGAPCVTTCKAYFQVSDLPSDGIIRFIVTYASGKELDFTFNLSDLH